MQTATTAPRVSPQPPPVLERYAHLCTTHGIPVKAAPVRPRLCPSISVTLPQQHVSTTQAGTHPVRSATTYKRSASTALAGTHNPVGADPRAGTGPFPKPQALVLPMVKFGQFKPDGIGHIDTADSDLMHHQYRLCPSQDWPEGTPPILLRRPVEGSMRLFFKKPVIMFRTSPISFLRILVTRTSLSCSIRTPLSLTLRCLPSGRAPQAEVLGAWFYSSFEHWCAAHHLRGHQLSHFAQYTFTTSLLRNVMHPLSYFSGFHGHMKQAQCRLHWGRLQHECFIHSW